MSKWVPLHDHFIKSWKFTLWVTLLQLTFQFVPKRIRKSTLWLETLGANELWSCKTFTYILPHYNAKWALHSLIPWLDLYAKLEMPIVGHVPYALYVKFLRLNHTFEHIHLVDILSIIYGPPNCLQSLSMICNNLFLMAFKLDNASWVDPPYGNLVLSQVHPMAITMDYNHCGDDVVLPTCS
jgi:hypothetical protein